MNSGSSAFIGSGGQSASTLATASWYQTSRPSTMFTGLPVTLTTITRSTPETLASASSTFFFSAMVLPPRRPSSAVRTILLPQSATRPAIESAEKPAKTTECTAPMRAQASMATAVSMIMGM
ncbi:hypothetical protein FQZ97_1134880 [compost metagenome]